MTAYTLASNAWGLGLQIECVVNWLEREQPEKYAELIAAFPDLPRALATVSGTSSWIDTEACGLDPDFDSWVVDWIEQNTTVIWDEGEPWSEDPNPEEE